MSHHSKNSPARVMATQRRQQAVQLRTEGATYKDIARQVGISRQRAFQLVDEAMSTSRAECSESIEELRARELAKIDALEGFAWEKAAAGDLKAVETVLRVMTRRAKLLGLDAPTRTQVEQTVNPLSSLTDEQLLLEAERLGLDCTAYRECVTVAQISTGPTTPPAN